MNESAAVVLLATALVAAGTASLYLTAPRQQWLGRPLSSRHWRGIGAVLWLAGWWLWGDQTRPVTALFVALMLSMLVLVAMPLLAVLREAHQARQSAPPSGGSS